MRRGEDRADVSEAQAAAELPSRPAGAGEADADRLPVQHGRVQGPVEINTRRARILVKIFHVLMLHTTLNTCTPACPTHPPLNLKCYTASFFPSIPTSPKKSQSHPKPNETKPNQTSQNPPQKTPPSVRPSYDTHSPDDGTV